MQEASPSPSILPLLYYAILVLATLIVLVLIPWTIAAFFWTATYILELTIVAKRNLRRIGRKIIPP